MDLDTRIFYDINNFARDTPWLHPVVAGYANDGVVLFAGFLLAGWWIARRTNNLSAMTAALWAPLGVLAAVAINQPIADSINATRPCNALPHIVVLHCNTDGGFPSIHAVIAAAAAASQSNNWSGPSPALHSMAPREDSRSVLPAESRSVSEDQPRTVL